MKNIEEPGDFVEVIRLLNQVYCETQSLMNSLENLTLSQLKEEILMLRSAAGIIAEYDNTF